MQGGNMRVNVGKRIFNEPNGVFRTISVFSEKEPEPEVNQIREFRPNLAEILAEAEREVTRPAVGDNADEIVAANRVVAGFDAPPAPEPPAKPKRIWKPRPNRNQKKKVT
jgi:hypothetical protein